MKGRINMEEDKIKRFSIYRIIEHWIHAFLFTILVLTGLSQKFYYLNISESLIFHLGGIDYVRLIHRYVGMIFAFLTIIHSAAALVGILSGRWQASMRIGIKDFYDLIHNIKYYAGIEKCPAYCDRYSYRQKFEYWAVLTSAFIMTVTGFMLWFPVSFTKLLPGEFIPPAHVMHTSQGIVVFVIIALWHIYNSIFSPNIFPIDPVIFTGYISRERMMLEHPLELARMESKEVEEILEECREIENRTLEEV